MRRMGMTELLQKKTQNGASSDICANIVISIFRKPRLSADDRRVAVLNTAFAAFLWPAELAEQLCRTAKQKAAQRRLRSEKTQ